MVCLNSQKKEKGRDEPGSAELLSLTMAATGKQVRSTIGSARSGSDTRKNDIGRRIGDEKEADMKLGLVKTKHKGTISRREMFGRVIRGHQVR